jgi:hypothetical protein
MLARAARCETMADTFRSRVNAEALREAARQWREVADELELLRQARVSRIISAGGLKPV